MFLPLPRVDSEDLGLANCNWMCTVKSPVPGPGSVTLVADRSVKNDLPHADDKLRFLPFLETKDLFGSACRQVQTSCRNLHLVWTEAPAGLLLLPFL